MVMFCSMLSASVLLATDQPLQMLKHNAVSFLVEVGMACSLACWTSESDLGETNRDAG